MQLKPGICETYMIEREKWMKEETDLKSNQETGELFEKLVVE